MKVLVAECCMESVTRGGLLKRHYEVVVAANGAHTLSLIGSEDAPQLAVLAWSLPDMSGLEAASLVRKKARQAYTYILMVMPDEINSSNSSIEAINAGADDCISERFDEHELLVRLRAGKRVVNLHKSL